ncbi:MAG: DUF4271 domain-containing protein [Chitinophagaceae bacterium]|nr:DUF4271 domain-containing protein [Chitinophagaceae bacterium]
MLQIIEVLKPIFLLVFFLIVCAASLFAQQTDSLITQKDTSQVQPLPGPADTLNRVIAEETVLSMKNKLLNSDAAPVSLAVQLKSRRSGDNFFYLVTGIVLLLAFLKYFYSRYFTNLFRVFFNTSLRQSQLTDQLLQAKLPSLLFNLFFVISGGIYVFILLNYYEVIPGENNRILILTSIALLGIIYFLKFCTLKFTGWVSGLSESTNTYIFIIFLINKIIGVFLVPFIIILSFSDKPIVKTGVIISLMSIGIFLLLRFFRSYGLLQNQLKISRFHFFLYIAGIELLPLLLIYKGLMVYLSKIL